MKTNPTDDGFGERLLALRAAVDEAIEQNSLCEEGHGYCPDCYCLGFNEEYTVGEFTIHDPKFRPKSTPTTQSNPLPDFLQ